MTKRRYHVIIPVCAPDGRFLKLLYALQRQSIPPSKITVMHTKVQGEDTTFLDRAKELVPDLDIVSLAKKDFDHAGTRNAGIARGDADEFPYFLLMTQDAVPGDRRMAEHLFDAMDEEKDGRSCAVAYARQVAGKDAPYEEKCLRAFNYPSVSHIRTAADVGHFGIKAYFCSNVCALYDRGIFEEEGPFAVPAVFNEDMVYAATVMQAGYAVSYAADAVVTHTHNDSLRERFLRSAQMGKSQAAHRDIFANVPSEGEGWKFVKYTLRRMVSAGKLYRIPLFFLQCAVRYAGYLYGKYML